MQINETEKQIILDALRVAHGVEWNRLCNYEGSYKLGKLSDDDFIFLQKELNKKLKDYKTLITKFEY